MLIMINIIININSFQFAYEITNAIFETKCQLQALTSLLITMKFHGFTLLKHLEIQLKIADISLNRFQINYNHD